MGILSYHQKGLCEVSVWFTLPQPLSKSVKGLCRLLVEGQAPKPLFFIGICTIDRGTGTAIFAIINMRGVAG